MDQKIERENGQGIGALLRASRLRCGEELDDVAAILRIRRLYLEAIEEGRFADLPGSTYAVGFIRAYAEHLGLDSSEVVRRFKSSDGQPTRGKPELVFPVPVAETGVPGGAIVFVGVLVAVVAYGAWYLSSTKDGFFAELVSPLPERLASLANQQAPASPSPAGKDNQPSAAIAATLPERRADTAPAPAAIETKPVEVARLPDPVPAPATVATPAEVPKPATSSTEPAKPATPTAAQDTASPSATPEPTKVEKIEPATAPSVAATTAAPTTPAPVKIEKAETAPVDAKPADAGPANAQPATATGGNAEPTSEPASTPIEKPAASAGGKPAEVAALMSPDRSIDAPYRPEAGTAAAPPPAQRPAPVAKAIPKPAAKPETLAAPASVAPTSAASRIVVRAKSNSWIQVRDDVDNQLLLTRLLRAGDTYPVPNRPGLMLLTGNAGALEIQVDGEPVPGIGGGAVRRAVALDVERLRQGKAVVD